MRSTPLLATEAVSKRYRMKGPMGRRGPELLAVESVSFSLYPGGALGIVGESGSGKTTIARMVVGLEAPTSGTILIDGAAVSARPTRQERQNRSRSVQIVFQDPYTSLDPRQSLRSTLDEVQRVHFSRSRAERVQRVNELLDAVGLGSRDAVALPRELSGGQRQRAAIARALAAEPKAVILDEAVSALDVSVQAQILNLLGDLRATLGLAYVLISHDLAVVRHLSEYVLVMHRGTVVEEGATEQLLATPRNAYTRQLLASAPRFEQRARN